MAFAQQHARPIEGAVATIGVSDRVDFLRKTYGLLGAALIGFALICFGMMRFMPELSFRWTVWALSGFNWLLVVGMFVVVGMISDRLARSESSRGLQYLGLALGVVAYGFIFQPMLWYVFVKLGVSGGASLITQAALITLAIFVGLTATVFITKKDFSFLRGALMIASFAALGIIIASILFGFNLGGLFAGVMILLMAGYILYETSVIMRDFPPTAYVAAALMLFSTVATLFWYVIRLLMSLRSD
jgi:FtsH-binding integral membrane protein